MLRKSLVKHQQLAIISVEVHRVSHASCFTCEYFSQPSKAFKVKMFFFVFKKKKWFLFFRERGKVTPVTDKESYRKRLTVYIHLSTVLVFFFGRL